MAPPSDPSAISLEKGYTPEEAELIEKLEHVVKATPQAHTLKETKLEEIPTTVEFGPEEKTQLFSLNGAPIFSPENTPERYKILQTLGSGGMGVVQLAYDCWLGREVALKRIPAFEKQTQRFSKKQTMLWRLHQEACITSFLEHPNIVPLYDLQKTASGEIQFTMRKVDGKTLRQLFQEKNQEKIELEENDFLLIFLKICEAIAYAHARGVIHRDLKPENIMVGTFGQVYVMDWGIAKRESDPRSPSTEDPEKINTLMNQTIGGLGTPGYMPPEQQENASLASFQSDIFSLGRILKDYFTGLSPQEELKKQIEDDTKKRKFLAFDPNLDPKTYFNPQIPQEIQHVIQNAIQEKKEHRYPTISAMMTDLEQYQQKQNRWEEAYQKAKDALEASEKKSLSTKLERAEKTQHLLRALNYLDSALILKKNKTLEELKHQTSLELIQIFCQNQDFSFAQYLVKELQLLSVLTLEEKQQIHQQVENQRTQQMREHLKTFEFWEKKFRTQKQTEHEREDAIFEISKMPEDEIFQKLLQILEEGLRYFLREDRYLVKECEFYKVMVTILGRLENPQAVAPFLSALTEMCEKLSNKDSTQQSLHAIQYMITLARALGYTKVQGTAQALQAIRQKVGHGLFRTQTRSIYDKLALLEGMESDPETAEDFIERGWRKYRQRDLEGAIQDYDQAILLDPRNDEAYRKRGTAKKAKHELSGAIEDYTQAILLNPKESQSYTQRAETRMYERDFQVAIQDCTWAIELNAEDVYAYYYRGNAKKELGDLEGAILDYSKALALNPQLAVVYNRRGLAKNEQEFWDEAIEDYTQALLLNKEDVYAYLNRGNARHAKGDFLGALEDLRSFLYYAPESHSQFQTATQLMQQIQNQLNEPKNCN
ncbi:MAG: tetratricopeptide repeat protein [Planctomycetota bacterium]